MKIPNPDEQRQTYLAQLQPHVAEPILAVGFLCTAGYVDGLTADHTTGKALGMLSPLSGRMFRKKATTTRVDSARNDLVAVTASSVHLFEYPKRGEAFTVSGPPTTWARAGLRVTSEAPKKLSQRIHVQFPGGEVLDYDIAKGGREWATFSDHMRDLLLEPVPAG